MPAIVRKYPNLILTVVLLVALYFISLGISPLSSITNNGIYAAGYVMMALGLNIVVGYAGLLDLGYVAFYAIGAYTVGWFASDFFTPLATHGLHFGASTFASTIPGVHLSFILLVIIAMALTGLAGVIIGLPTLRLRGDYIAIVTLAFGEIVYRFAANGDSINFTKPLHQITFGLIGETSGVQLTNGRQAISPTDQLTLPGMSQFDSATNLRPYFWVGLVMVALALFVNFRLRDSRLGRAWVAIREDEVAAASMGVPLVKTKLMAYATGGALGGAAGAFLGTYANSVQANVFQFGFSIFILAMVILGGLGSIWGVVIGAVSLSFLNTYFIPEVINTLPSKVGLNFDLTTVNFGIFGFVIVLVMVLRPEGILPERRRKLELTEGIGVDDATFEVNAP
jgi:branched-chain amino acid transport system permease protein